MRGIRHPNIDFSTKLHGELQRMRPTGDALRHRSRRADGGHGRGGDAREEDRPAGKLGNGLSPVHSTMTLGLTHFRLAPIDLFNLCRTLRKRRARKFAALPCATS